MSLFNIRSNNGHNVIMTIIADSKEEALELAVKRWDWNSYAEYCADSYTGFGDLYAQKQMD